MASVVRVVRLPDAAGENVFQLTLPAGSTAFKVDNMFTGRVDGHGNPVECACIFVLADAAQTETEPVTFVRMYLAAGIDDLTSEVPALPDGDVTYIGTLQGGAMIFAVPGAEVSASARLDQVPVVTI